MTEIAICIACTNCRGEAYIPVGEAESYSGEKYTRYQPCPVCQGSGLQSKHISLEELSILLSQVQCKHEHTFFQGSMRFVAGDVEDDITEVCSDCGAILDWQVLGDFIELP